MPRILLPLAALLALAGYFGPWVPHRAAGLVVSGLDLGEYVKFLPPVRSGEIALWRPAFYLPLLAVSLALSLHAYRPALRYGRLLRALLLAGAGVAALNMLPPAWSPAVLRLPEFRTQVAWIALCLAALLASPLLALLPRAVPAALTALLALAALALPVAAFLRVLPAASALYNYIITPGWGPWALGAGLILLAAAALLLGMGDWRIEIEE